MYRIPIHEYPNCYPNSAAQRNRGTGRRRTANAAPHRCRFSSSSSLARPDPNPVLKTHKDTEALTLITPIPRSPSPQNPSPPTHPSSPPPWQAHPAALLPPAASQRTDFTIHPTFAASSSSRGSGPRRPRCPHRRLRGRRGRSRRRRPGSRRRTWTPTTPRRRRLRSRR
jgi:hypothetical protein